MNNNLKISVQIINDNFVVGYNKKKENLSDELIIKQKINLLTKEVFSIIDQKMSTKSIKQINFVFKENNNVTVIIKNSDGNIEYDLTANQNIVHRAQELAGLINKTKKIAQVIHPKSFGLGPENPPPFIEQKNDSSSLYTSSMISFIYKSIERWYTSTFHLQPDVDLFATSFFSHIKNEKDLRQEWKTSQQSLSNKVDELYHKWNEGRTNELFSKEELFTLISQKLEKSFTSRFQILTNKVISEGEMKLLRNERTLLEAISRLEKGGDEQDIKQNERYWSETIDSIPAIDFPIEQLAQIKLSLQTEKHSIRTWDRILKELVEKGDLNKIVDTKKNPVEAMKQIRFTDTYIHACHLLPKEFRNVFEEFHILDTHRLENFIRAQPNALELKSLSHDELGKQRESILQECIRPIIDKNRQQLLKNHMDFIPIINMISTRETEALTDLVNQIEAKLNEKSVSASEKEQLGLTRDKLIDFLIFDFEQIGIEHYSISNEQLLHARQKRQFLAIQSQQTQFIEQQVFDSRNFPLEINEIEKKLNQILKKPFSSVDQKNTLSLPPEKIELLKNYLENIDNKISYFETQDTKLHREFLIVKEKLENILNHSSQVKENDQIFTLLKKHQQLTTNLKKASVEIFDNISILEFPLKALTEFSISGTHEDFMIDVWSTLLKKMDAVRKDETQSDDVKGQAHFKFRVIKRFFLETSPGKFKYEMAKELERLEKPTELTKNLINRLNQEVNLEEWKQEIQKIKPSDIQLELLAAMPISQGNAEPILALWTHLMNESINPIVKDIDQIESKDFLKNMNLKNVKKYEDALINYTNLVEILSDVTDPLITNEIQSIQDESKMIMSKKVQAHLNIARKKFFPIGKALELTDVELLIGNQQKASPISIQANPQQKKEFNTFEIQGLQILTKALASLELRNETVLSLEESKQLDEFIEFARKPGPHRKALNAKLQEIMHGEQKGIAQLIKDKIFTPEDKRLHKHIPFGISSAAVELILGVTYQLRNSDQFKLLADNLENLLNKIDNGEEIHPNEQMTIKELGILAKCIKIGDDKKEKSLLTKLQEIVTDKKETDFMQFSETSKRAEKLFERLNQKFNGQTSSYKAGDFVAKVGEKEHEFYGHQTTGMEQLHFKLVTPFSHGAKIYVVKGQAKLSEVLGSYSQSNYEFYDEICSEVWRLEISKMIPKKQKELLLQVYGENWSQILQNKYESIENGIHQNKNQQFSQITNPWERRLQAGKADYMWGGHVKKGETDFQHLAKRMLGNSKDKKDRLEEMICSEFVTKTTLTALFQLNQQISQEVDEWNNKQEEENKIKNNGNILELPISKKEKLSRVHPGRMIALFKKRNCIRKLKATEKPNIVQQIIRAI